MECAIYFSVCALRTNEPSTAYQDGQQGAEQSDHGAGGALLRDARAETRGGDQVLPCTALLRGRRFAKKTSEFEASTGLTLCHHTAWNLPFAEPAESTNAEGEAQIMIGRLMPLLQVC